MWVNVPSKLTKKDIKNCGIIFKDEGFSYVLSDLQNRDKNKTLKLSGYGYFNYVYNVCNTYLFIIGNQVKNKDINPNKIDFLSKILKFEYLLAHKNKQIQKFDVPSGVFTIISKQKWLQDDFIGSQAKSIDFIVKHKKVHLQSYERPYERYMRYICDNIENGLGTFKNGLCKDLLTQNFIHIQKDTNIDGYIIKTDNSLFEC